LTWRTRRRGWARTTTTKRTRKQAVATVKKSRETRSRRWLERKVRQVWNGGVCRLLGLEFLAAQSPALSGRDGALVRPRRPEPAPDRRPADESTAGPEGEDDHQGTGKPGTGPD
jgi:hypothetical protein